MWAYVISHFRNFQRNIELRPEEHDDALAKAERIGRCLHAAYYTGDFDLSKLLICGSYGKATAIRPTSDVDLLYFLPREIFLRYNDYATGGQSALLQDVRTTLLETFPRTDIKADGQAVVVDYDSRRFEVVPAFNFEGQIYIADTVNGGKWKPTNILQEAQDLNRADYAAGGHIKSLIKYIKVWKRVKEVPLKSVVIEHTAFHFVQQWYCTQSSQINPVYWHDWLVRDFFEFLLKHETLTLAYGEVIMFGDGWQGKARKALEEAKKACEYEQADQGYMAAIHWQNIFGTQFPFLNNDTVSRTNRTSLLTGI